MNTKKFLIILAQPIVAADLNKWDPFQKIALWLKICFLSQQFNYL